MSKFTRKNSNVKSEGQPIYSGSRIIGTVRGACFYKSIAANGYLQKPRRVTCCELCGAADQVRLTADADRGGLQLCADCRRSFGFEGGQDGNN